MNTHSILSFSPSLSILTFSPHKTSPFPQSFIISQTLGFCSPKSLRTLAPNSPRLRASFKSSSSLYPIEPHLSDADDDDEEEEDEDDDEDVAADEYDDVSGDLSDGVEQTDYENAISIAVATEELTRQEEFKWQRVEKLCNEVRVFGEDVIDVDELASIHDFRIDKFQVYF